MLKSVGALMVDVSMKSKLSRFITVGSWDEGSRPFESKLATPDAAPTVDSNTKADVSTFLNSNAVPEEFMCSTLFASVVKNSGIVVVAAKFSH